MRVIEQVHAGQVRYAVVRGRGDNLRFYDPADCWVTWNHADPLQYIRLTCATRPFAEDNLRILREDQRAKLCSFAP